MNTLLYREIRPEGWLRRQLEIQARGLSGHLDKIWPDVRDSAWIGGDREGWERVPYWLDGFIPLAHLLRDEDLIARADRYVQCIVDRQQEDGWICPCTEEQRASYDLWAVLLIGKVLALHCEFTADERVETALRAAMKNLHDLMAAGTVHLSDWGKFRWFEGLVPLIHLQQRQPEEWLPSLGRMLREQGADWPSFQPLWLRAKNQWRQETHIVNLCMMLKYEALCCAFFGEERTHQADALWAVLEAHHGTAVGTFTGDECLSGTSNTQGTELCAVVELMYTCEWLYAVTGDPVWAERLEKVAFNAMPATFTDDMWAHQYDQMVNQMACVEFPGRAHFRTNSSESHLFGLEPNYGCCTANMHQGWPKLALHALQRMEEGFEVAHLLPVSAQTQVNGTPVCIRVEGDYPFRMQAEITVDVQGEAAFVLAVRVPAWAKNVRLNGKAIRVCDGRITLERTWRGCETLHLTFSTAPHFVSRPTGLKTVEYGPLVFALPVQTEYRMREYTRNDVERKFPYCDYELIPQSPWNYGFAASALTVEEHPMDAVPFSSVHPPVSIRVQLAPVEWDWEDGFDTVPAVRPAKNIPAGPAEEARLIPYGCAKLRMTELPRLRMK